MLPKFSNHWALFLDVDGTLVDFLEHPADTRAGPRLTTTVRELYRLNQGAVALVSGRTIESLDTIFQPLRLPCAGLHGQQRRDPQGNVHQDRVDPRMLAMARDRFNECVGKHPGTFVEEKGESLALHYRRAPHAAPDVESIAWHLEQELVQPMCVQRGKMVVEVRSCSHSKGTAIEAFSKEPPFARRTPVFLGDDATDEHGFRWVNDHGGLSIKVGEGASAARFRIGSVQGVLQWLDDYLDFLGKQDGAGHGC